MVSEGVYETIPSVTMILSRKFYVQLLLHIKRYIFLTQIFTYPNNIQYAEWQDPSPFIWLLKQLGLLFQYFYIFPSSTNSPFSSSSSTFLLSRTVLPSGRSLFSRWHLPRGHRMKVAFEWINPTDTCGGEKKKERLITWNRLMAITEITTG